MALVLIRQELGQVDFMETTEMENGSRNMETETRKVAHSLCLYCKLMYFFLCIIVVRSVSLATHWQCYVCIADVVIGMTELAYIVL